MVPDATILHNVETVPAYIDLDLLVLLLEDHTIKMRAPAPPFRYEDDRRYQRLNDICGEPVIYPSAGYQENELRLYKCNLLDGTR